MIRDVVCEQKKLNQLRPKMKVKVIRVFNLIEKELREGILVSVENKHRQVKLHGKQEEIQSEKEVRS